MERRFLFISVLLLTGSFAFSGGCRGGTGPLPFHPLAEAQSWAILTGDPTYLVLTEKNWQAYYRAIPLGADFNNNFYLVASWGLKPNPGYRISITRVEQSGSLVEVRLKLEEPDPKKVYPQVMVRPTAVSEIRKDSLRQLGPLTFEFLDQRGNRLARMDIEL